MDSVIKSLFAPSPRVDYGVSGEKDLILALEKSDRVSRMIPVREFSVAGMASDTTFGGLRLTSWGFYQICQVACPGMYKALVEMTARGDDASVLAAIHIFNQTLRLRRQELNEHLFLCDMGSKTIEAMVSPQYRFFKNLDFYRQVSDAALGCSFAGATTGGRWLALRYYHHDKLFEAPDSKYHAGYYFANHEGGKSAISMANAIFRAKGSVCFLREAHKSVRVRHTGKGFMTKFGGRLRVVMDYRWDADKMSGHVASSIQAPLGLGLENGKAENLQQRRLSFLLQMAGLPKSLSASIVANAIAHPHSEPRPLPVIGISRSDLRSRVGYDLAIAAGRLAKECPVALREKVERAAFGVLTGRMKLVR